MKKLLIIALLLLAFVLVSCDGETPSESLPSESAPEVSTHVCDFSGEPEYDENGHFVTCECGEVSRNEHEFEDLKIIKEATCVKEGSKTVKCKNCKYQETVAIPKLEHTKTKIDEVSATCVKEGVSAYEHCDICNIDIGKTVLPKVEHDYKEDHYCTICGGHEYITFKSTTYGMVAVKKNGIDTEDLTELIVPTHTEDGIRVIGIEKLNFSNMKKVTIPDGIKYIFDDAFSNSNYLEEVVFLSESTTAVEIHKRAFYGCRGLKKITFPKNCVFVKAHHTFSLNKSLKTIDIPDGIETLGEFTFWGCILLEKVTIPDSVKTVERDVFKDCYSLKEVDLGNGITELSREMFMGCSALETIVIPDSVTRICDKVFYGCDNLKTVVLPKSLTELSSLAFYACISLKEIKFEGTIEEWKSKDFYVYSGERIICSDGVIEL